MNRRLYALHRWIAALALVQLAIWLGSGIFFASVSIERVRGAAIGEPPTLTPDDGAALLSASTVLGVAASAGIASPRVLELRATASGPMYLVRGRHHDERVRIDARTGALAPVGREEAAAIAARDQAAATIVAADLVESAPPIEYRDQPLPAWRVTLADGAGTAVWIDARTGDVVARRNDLWRTYDFLWSLHIMDYRGRETFHHPLLVAAAALAALTVLSGAALWAFRLVRRLRSRVLPSP